MAGESRKDSDRITSFLRELESKEWLSNHKWWPRFLYHFTDIENAVSILREEALYSRNTATKKNLMLCDNASPDVIGNTPEELKDYVRLYFRPRTPTQYRNEGFIPEDRQKLNAHCPVPIIFLFESKPILINELTFFSDGNIASPEVEIKGTTDFLLSLNFQDIYHDTSLFGYDPYRKSQIKYHRQSEILIKNMLSLDNLKNIFCRSRAEYETLKSLMGENLWKEWSRLIGVDNKGSFFFNRWPYISEVDLSSESIRLGFNPVKAGPYKIRVKVTGLNTNIERVWGKDTITFEKEIKLNLSQKGSLAHYLIQVEINDHIAYQNEFSEKEIIT